MMMMMNVNDYRKLNKYEQVSWDLREIGASLSSEDPEVLCGIDGAIGKVAIEIDQGMVDLGFTAKQYTKLKNTHDLLLTEWWSRIKEGLGSWASPQWEWNGIEDRCYYGNGDDDKSKICVSYEYTARRGIIHGGGAYDGKFIRIVCTLDLTGVSATVEMFDAGGWRSMTMIKVYALIRLYHHQGIRCTEDIAHKVKEATIKKAQECARSEFVT